MLSKNQINRACKHAMNNILSEGLTDVPLMNKAFESDFYRKDCDVRKEVIDIVTERIMSNDFDELKLNPLNHILIPKRSMLITETALLWIFSTKRFTSHSCCRSRD